MTRRPYPTVLDHLVIGGLKPELIAEFKDRHQRRTPCRCRLCEEARRQQVAAHWPEEVGPGE
jgi:hypothetical protein